MIAGKSTASLPNSNYVSEGLNKTLSALKFSTGHSRARYLDHALFDTTHGGNGGLMEYALHRYASGDANEKQDMGIVPM